MGEELKKENKRIHENTKRFWENNKKLCSIENAMARKKFLEKNKKRLMNKRGQVSGVVVVVVVIFIFLVMAAVAVGIIVVTKGGYFSGDSSKNEFGKIDLYLQDKCMKETNYMITTTTNSILSQGTLLEDAYLPIKIMPNDTVNIYCWADDRYSEVVEKEFTVQDKKLNKTKVDCESTKIGNLNVVVQKGDLARDENRIIIDLTANGGEWHGLGFCMAWTSGIKSIENLNTYVECDKGFWANYSYYDAITQKYDPLPEGVYKCGESHYETCKLVDSDRCYQDSIEVLTRYSKTMDRCYYIGEDIEQDETYTLRLDVETFDDKNSLDKLKFIFFDSDKRYVDGQEYWIYAYQKGTEDIGAEDVTAEIKYTPAGYEIN